MHALGKNGLYIHCNKKLGEVSLTGMQIIKDGFGSQAIVVYSNLCCILWDCNAKHTPYVTCQ
jgi:hypothetical protein